MAYYVCKGAKLKCSMGSDINIKPFGKCKSLANPVVAAATSYVPSEITAECSGVEASIHARRPKWEDVHRGYPKVMKDGSEADMYMDDVFRYILGSNYDHKLFSNGGAARISIGLTRAGLEVKKDFLVQDGSEFKKELIAKNKENEKKRIGFIASAKNLQEWLSSVWGKADVEIKGKATIEAVQAAINGRNGIYIILGGFDSGTSGATTLWIGSSNDALAGLNYVYKGGTVYFWELRGEGGTGKGAKAGTKTLVEKVESKGDDNGIAYFGQKITYRVTSYNKSEVSESDRSSVKWAIKEKDKQKKEKDKLENLDGKGEEIILEMKEEWVSKEILVMPYLNEPTEDVAVKTIVRGFPILIAWSSRQSGKNADGTEAKDMHCGDMTKENILKIFCARHIPSKDMRYISYSIDFENADYHFREFKYMATTYFAKDNVEFDEYEFPEDLTDDIKKKNGATHKVNLESNIISMIEHLRNKGGKNYSNPDLTAAVMSHEDTIRFINKIRKLFIEELKNKKGNIAEIEKDRLDTESIEQPKYDTWSDRAQGLAIAIHNTWAYEAQVTEYKLEKDGTYKGKMKIIIYDHFGLDDDDVKPNKRASNFDGFYNWFALQRWEGFGKKYKPFVTVLEKEFTFKGKLQL